MVQIAANGIRIEYEDTGPADAAPLLVIQGFGSQLTSWPDELHEGFAARGLRVIRFDNRDVGLTQKFGEHGIPDMKAVMEAMQAGRKPPVAYTLNDMADDAAALLDALGIASAHIAGASMGGMIAQLVAIRHPEKVRSLISIMSTTSDPSLPRSEPEAQAALMTPPPSTAKDDVVAQGLKARRVIGSPLYPVDEAWLAERLGMSYERSYYPQGPSRHWAAIMASPPRTEMLKKLNVPTLVLHGEADILVKPEAGRHTAAMIPGAAYHEIKGWGHDMNPKIAPVLIGLMASFIERVEAERDEAFSRPAAPGCCGSAAAQ